MFPLLAFIALLLSFAQAQEGPSRAPGAQAAPPDVQVEMSENEAELPVTRVVLFTGGIGYFEHTGTVEGTAEVELPVGAEHMDDLLQSLVLRDLDGGTIEPVRYPARDPLGRVLSSYSLDLSDDPTLAQILSRARGERVEVVTTSPLVATLVNVEQVPDGEDGVRTFLTLSTDTGLQRVPLDEVHRIAFVREELQAELDAALSALSRYRQNEERTVRLRFSGEGERRVSVGYVREMPVWKTSYRLVLAEDDTATLQGWAIFDNPTSLDLEDVSVSFVAGQPISFITNLYEPVYLDRPRVDVAVAPGIVPPEYAGGMVADGAPAPMPAEALGRFLGAGAEQEDFDATAGVEAMAQGSRTVASFEYRVATPVTIPRYESAMIPIIQEEVPARLISVFDRSVLANNPLRGVMLDNDTGLHLSAGPVSVFYGSAGGAFAGTSRLGEVVPGDSRMLTFAVDLDVEVFTEAESPLEQVVSVRLADGVLETDVRIRAVTEYGIVTAGEAERLLVVEHPGRSGYSVVSPEPAPARTDGGYRFGVMVGAEDGEGAADGAEPADGAGIGDIPVQLVCPAGGDCTLRVVMERIERQTVAVSDLGVRQIGFYLENVELSDEDRRALEEIRDVLRDIDRLRQEIASVEARIEAIHRDQERIRGNMGELERDSALYRRYLGDLEEQENELDALESELARLEEELQAAREELSELVAGAGTR